MLNFTREELYSRHRLSHNQINDLFGVCEYAQSVHDKVIELKKIFEFLSIADIFSQKGIEYVSYKGPLLSYRLYGDTTIRRYNDFDFLIPRDNIRKAINVLIDRGYSTPVYKFPEDKCRQDILQRHNTELYLYHPEKKVSVEIHWNLFTWRFIPVYRMNEIIFSNLEELDFTERKFKVFNKEFELVYLVIHGGLHRFRRIKWLVDIYDYLKIISFDEEKFINLSAQLRATRLIALCNELLGIYFPGSRLLPSESKGHRRMVDYAVHSIHTPKDEDTKNLKEYLNSIQFSLIAFPGFDYKLSIIQSVLFATDLAYYKKIPCNRFTYYFISPFYKLYRGFR